MCVCHTLVSSSMGSLWMLRSSLCVCRISVQLCVFSACWVPPPRPFVLMPGPCFGSQGSQGDFLLGYADKLMLPDWLTAPSVAGTGRNALWIPSDGRERFFHFYFFFYPLFVSHKHAHTKQYDIIAQNPEFQMGPAQGKSPKSSLKSGSEPNPQLRGIRSESLRGLAIGHRSIPRCPLSPSPSPFLPFSLSFCSSLSQILDSCFTLWKKKGGK